ncbi:Nif3-like dinuclear metal center hexameric protein [Methanobrevibacter sp.]|uniref:Nif3-like dinuclear metal center hexameric protein n=1 Tax=Methanobrevibacter sp. TaxID=66852 RepID=UPI003D7D0364
MKLKEITDFLNKEIPESLALDFDNVGYKKDYDLSQEITSIKIYMDLLVEDDEHNKNTLIITHHPPLFTPKTPTYTIHSNWDIIDGGANDALADTLNLEVIDYLDENTKIGRICKSNQKFKSLKENIINNFKNTRIVNNLDDSKTIKKVGIISGFGLKNPEYIKLSKQKDLDILISGDLTQETAILAKKLNLTLIDLNHHDSELPGLYALANIINKLNINIEVIDKNPIEELKMEK